MKTALTQLIEIVETAFELKNNPAWQQIFESHLEAEKEQIMEAVEFCDAHCDEGHFDKEGAIVNIKRNFNL